MSSTQPLFTPDEWHAIVRTLDLPRQQAGVLAGLVNSFSDKQISESMGIGVPTVRSYLSRMYAKFGVQDRTALVIYTFSIFREIHMNQGV